MAATKRHNSRDVVAVLPTRDSVGRESVAEIQRARMLAAMVDVVAERGAANASVAHVVARSGVSRRTFYEIFEDREDCFLATFDQAVERIAEQVVPAYEAPGSWQAKIRAALTELLACLDEDPRIGRLLIVESLAAGPKALRHRTRVLAGLIAAIDAGRKTGIGTRTNQPPPLSAEGVAGGALSVLHARLTGGEPKPLVELVNPLMGMIVLPFLGQAAANRENDQQIPKKRPPHKTPQRDPLQDLDMRLTYRTVRVLMAVATSPGSSNRIIGNGAGIEDQGQISKLLTRLQRLGLIDNAGAGPARGEPNAWTLTNKGWEIHGAIAGQVSAS